MQILTDVYIFLLSLSRCDAKSDICAVFVVVFCVDVGRRMVEFLAHVSSKETCQQTKDH